MTTSDGLPVTSSFFNAKYDGVCAHDDCYKHNDIEPGDGCLYYKNELMHMRCARAKQRAENDE